MDCSLSLSLSLILLLWFGVLVHQHALPGALLPTPSLLFPRFVNRLATQYSDASSLFLPYFVPLPYVSPSLLFHRLCSQNGVDCDSFRDVFDIFFEVQLNA